MTDGRVNGKGTSQPPHSHDFHHNGETTTMNHLLARWALASVVVLAAICSRNGSALAAPGENAADKVFVGYLFGQPRNINFGLYTHLCHAFLTADAEGRVQKRGTVPSRPLTDDAHKA